MSKAQITLTVDKQAKEKFQDIAKKMGSNMSTLVNMYFIQVAHTGKVEYSVPDDEPVEMGFIPYDKLSEESKALYNKSLTSDPSKRINI